MRNCLSVRERSWEGVQVGRGGWGGWSGGRKGVEGVMMTGSTFSGSVRMAATLLRDDLDSGLRVGTQGQTLTLLACEG